MKVFNCHVLEAVAENGDKKFGFNPNNSLAKANETNNYSPSTPAATDVAIDGSLEEGHN